MSYCGRLTIICMSKLILDTSDFRISTTQQILTITSKHIKVKGKVVPVILFFNSAPRHEGVLGSERIAPRILDLGTRWR
jgi:hypothetical protein